MVAYIHKGDDFLSLQEKIAEMAILSNVVNTNENGNNQYSGERPSDTINYDLKITLTKVRKKKC